MFDPSISTLTAPDLPMAARRELEQTPRRPDAFLDRFRCPDSFALFDVASGISQEEGYFRFDGTTCYGRCAAVSPLPHLASTEGLTDVSSAARWDGRRMLLPFDLSEVVSNLQQERYQPCSPLSWRTLAGSRAVKRAYYSVRPVLPVTVRRHLQRLRLSDWKSLSFPRWPVDLSVEALMESALASFLRQRGIEEVPFIWFWPDDATGCVLMTHDVEGRSGRDFTNRLMDIDDSFDVKSSFQIIPQRHFYDWEELAAQLRNRGFEVNLHDLHHDGYLFENREEFLRRVVDINRHAKVLSCGGFRSGAMYREQRWFDAFEFSYDMSVPNVAHLEPQRGGCCTVMPYFVGKILELPLTTTQDYSLFHILGDYSITLWKEQISRVLSKNGLMSFIIHPDYLIEDRARRVYCELLGYLQHLRRETKLWIALPAEVDQWWRARRLMRLVGEGGDCRIEGPGSERARIAFATLEDDRVVYRLEGQSQPGPQVFDK